MSDEYKSHVENPYATTIVEVHCSMSSSSIQLSQYKVSSCHAASSFAGVGGVHGEARMDVRIAILS